MSEVEPPKKEQEKPKKIIQDREKLQKHGYKLKLGQFHRYSVNVDSKVYWKASATA